MSSKIGNSKSIIVGFFKGNKHKAMDPAILAELKEEASKASNNPAVNALAEMYENGGPIDE